MSVLCVLVAQSCPTLCHSKDCNPPGSSVHGILQARILEWLPFSASGIFLTLGSNPALLYCRQILYCLSHQGSPWWNIYLVKIYLGDISFFQILCRTDKKKFCPNFRKACFKNNTFSLNSELSSEMKPWRCKYINLWDYVLLWNNIINGLGWTEVYQIKLSVFVQQCKFYDGIILFYLPSATMSYVPFSAFTTVLQVSSLKAISLSITCILASLSSHIFLLTIYMLVIPKLCEVSALDFPLYLKVCLGNLV